MKSTSTNTVEANKDRRKDLSQWLKDQKKLLSGYLTSQQTKINWLSQQLSELSEQYRATIHKENSLRKQIAQIDLDALLAYDLHQQRKNVQEVNVLSQLKHTLGANHEEGEETLQPLASLQPLVSLQPEAVHQEEGNAEAHGDGHGDAHAEEQHGEDEEANHGQEHGDDHGEGHGDGHGAGPKSDKFTSISSPVQGDTIDPSLGAHGHHGGGPKDPNNWSDNNLLLEKSSTKHKKSKHQALARLDPLSSISDPPPALVTALQLWC